MFHFEGLLSKSKWIMNWINYGYYLVWNTIPPPPKEIVNSESSLEHHEFVTKAISEMMIAGAASVLPLGVRPTVVRPLRVVPTSHYNKLQLLVNITCVNEHLAKRVFEFESPSDVADMANKKDYSISYDLTFGYYHVALHPDSRRFVGF